MKKSATKRARMGALNQENITVTLDTLASQLVRWYADENDRPIEDVTNGVLAGELGHLRSELTHKIQDATAEFVQEYVLKAAIRRRHELPAPNPMPIEQAITVLQQAIARRFGRGFQTESGAGTLSISHDSLSLTNRNSRVVALDSGWRCVSPTLGRQAGSFARELAKVREA